MRNENCIYCAGPLYLVYDFGNQPLSNALLRDENQKDNLYPLRLLHCAKCDLYQSNRTDLDFFSDDYPYFSSINSTYKKQCQEFYSARLQNVSKDVNILEIGCNDGYLLSELQKMGFTNLYGYEPASKQAMEAARFGTVHNCTFDITSFGKVPKMDYVILNNVFAHTTKLTEILESLKLVCKPDCTIYIEVQDFQTLAKENAWDTIYHEHVSYFTYESVYNVVSKYFQITDFHHIPSHGGSLRLLLTPKVIPDYQFGKRYSTIDVDTFKRMIRTSKHNSLREILTWKVTHAKRIACFGAAAKGIAWLNYLGLDSDTIEYCVDETPSKIGKFMPKSKIPIISLEDHLKRKRPDIMLILPWNFKSEIKTKLKTENCVIKNLDGSFSNV